MNLITSEQENHTLESKPYGDVLVFSTQDPSLAQHKPKKRKERKKWSLTEDLVLISAWLNTSKDPVVGNAYWSRVAAYYAASPKVPGLEKREAIHCKPRWHKINNQVCKFVSSYEAATKEKSSGHNNEDDIIKLAYEIFFNDYKVKFTLEHAWRVLRHNQKWCGSSSTKDNGASKRRKCDDQSAQSSSYVPVAEDQARPPGVKASKGKAKKPVSKTTAVQEEGKSMWEIKKKDLEIKERISKNKLLDSLLAKTEPLSKIEMALKNKLITDMLSNS